MKLLVFIFLLVSQTCAAQFIGGIYSGTLENEKTHVKQNFELALTEYRGKIFGYSYTTFVRNDSLFYSVKKVTATRQGGKLVVEDEKMLANNFPEKPAKGVHQLTYVKLTGEDTLRQITGTWETNKTKVYYALGGGAAMQRNYDSSKSALIGHLEELSLLPSYKGGSQMATQPTITAKPDPVAATPSRLPPAERREVIIKTIEVSSDSLTLSLYDNGVVDGDSVSVQANGRPIFEQVRLKATATRKNISLKSYGSGEVKLVLNAESLGTIPPNTGLLSITDGSNIYQVYFSADFSTNAAIVLKPKP